MTDKDKIIEIDEFPWDKPSNNPIYFADDLIAIYSLFRDQVYKPSSVLYPSCALDASPVKVFDNVTFVDIDQKSIAKLQEAGLHALQQDIRAYQPKELHDLLILLNPAIRTEWASRHLKSGGYVIANNYHGNASEMYKQPEQFMFLGVIDFIERDRRKKDYRVAISRDLDNLFQPVANEEELKRCRPEYYDFLQGMFKSLALNWSDFSPDGPFEEVWANYRKIMQEGMPSKRVAERYIFVKK